MPDVFLSYSREDQPVARRFAEGLEREGLTVWWDQALNVGEAFDQVTERALAEAHAVVVLWSKTSVSSRWVRAEATQANAQNRLLPVMIEVCTRPILFELTHTADLVAWRGNRDDPAWQAFVAGVRRFVQQRAQGGTGAPVLEAAPRPTLGQRVSGLLAGVRIAAAQAGELLKRHAGHIAVALLGAAIAAGLTWKLRPQAAPEVTRFSITLPPMAFVGPAGSVRVLDVLGPVLSPDGRRLVYTTPNSSGTYPQLWSRRLDQDEATPIPGGEGAALGFFSPDGRSLAFWQVPSGQFGASNQLRAFDFGSEASRVVADLSKIGTGPAPVDGSWDGQGRIHFSQRNAREIFLVAAVGGEPRALVSPDKEISALASPHVLPGGGWVLLTAVGSGARPGDWSGADILAHNLATGENRLLARGGYSPRYLPPGYLVFARGGALHAIAFDARRVATRGNPVPVVQGVANNDSAGVGAFTVANNGTLVYIPGPFVPAVPDAGASGALVPVSVRRVSLDGGNTPVSAEIRDYFSLRVSPDGSKIALETTTDAGRHIWIMDAGTGVATQLTFEGENSLPVWTADGREVVFTSKRGETWGLWRMAADGSGQARHVLDGSSQLKAADAHGDILVYQDLRAGTNQRDLFTVDLAAGGEPKELLATDADESFPRISPDGRWIAYQAAMPDPEPAGRGYRVYVRPFPDTGAGGQRVISDAGRGTRPVWSPAGDAIYYYSPPAAGGAGTGSVWSASLAVTPTAITTTGRRELFGFEDHFFPRVTGDVLSTPFDVSRKSGDFIGFAFAPRTPAPVASAADTTPPRLNVVLNWTEELKKLAPLE